MTYDSILGEVFKADGTAQSFRPSNEGLFFSDVKSDIECTFINKVDNNKTKYTIKKYSEAARASSLQNIIGPGRLYKYITDVVSKFKIFMENLNISKSILMMQKSISM